MNIHVKNNISWVGKRDWEVEHFHGKEYKMQRGTSYNSYLIREEKTVLIDTAMLGSVYCPARWSHAMVQMPEKVDRAAMLAAKTDG